VFEFGEFLVGQDRRFELDQAGIFGPGLRRLRSEPMAVSVDMMSSSRSNQSADW